MSVALPENVVDFVKEKVASGSYGSSSEVISEALRLMQDIERLEAEKRVWLREAWDKGAASGDAGELDFAYLKRLARARSTGGA